MDAIRSGEETPMTSIVLEVAIIIALILLNGVLAMSEIAIVSARKTWLQRRAEEGGRGAQAALRLSNAPTQFLATVQIGISLVGVLAGAFGGATLAEQISFGLEQVPLLAPYAEAIGVAAVVLVVTYLSLVLGELVPKRLGLSNAEQVASTLGPAMGTLSRITAPLVRLLSLSTDLVLRLLGSQPGGQEPVTEEEIQLMIEEGTEVGVFEPGEQELVAHVFRLADAPLEALMMPRTEVVWVDAADPPEELKERIATGGHSRYPVARDDLDNTIGMLYARDLLTQCLAGQTLDLEAAVRPAVFLPETITALEAVEQMKQTRTDVALVIDEYGGVTGLVTADDVLEALVGEIDVPGEPLEPAATQRADGTWLLDGLLSVDEVKETLDIKELPFEDKVRYQTLGGLVLLSLGRIPTEGDRFACCNWRFEVVDMDGMRVDKVLGTRLDH
jgi:putative hemolysin